MMRKILGLSVAITLLSLWSGVLSADLLSAQHQYQWRSDEQYQYGKLDLNLPAEALAAVVAQVPETGLSIPNAQDRTNENRYRYRNRNREKKSYSYGKYGEGSSSFSASRHQIRSGGVGGSTSTAAGKGRR